MSLRIRLLDVVMALPELPDTHGSVGACGDALERTVIEHLSSDEAAAAFLAEMHRRGWLTNAKAHDDYRAAIRAAADADAD